MNCLKVICIGDGEFFNRDNVTRINAVCHMHNGNAGFLLTCHNCSLHWSGASILWKKAHVEIDAAELGVIKNVARQNFAICHNHDKVGIYLGEE